MSGNIMRDRLRRSQRRLMVGVLSTLGVFMTSAPLVLVGCAGHDDGDTPDRIENNPSAESSESPDCFVLRTKKFVITQHMDKVSVKKVNVLCPADTNVGGKPRIYRTGNWSTPLPAWVTWSCKNFDAGATSGAQCGLILAKGTSSLAVSLDANCFYPDGTACDPL